MRLKYDNSIYYVHVNIKHLNDTKQCKFNKVHIAICVNYSPE